MTSCNLQNVLSPLNNKPLTPELSFVILWFEKVDIMDGNNKWKVQEVKRNCFNYFSRAWAAEALHVCLLRCGNAVWKGPIGAAQAGHKRRLLALSCVYEQMVSRYPSISEPCSSCQGRSSASPRVQHLFSKELGFVSMRNSLLIAASQLWHWWALPFALFICRKPCSVLSRRLSYITGPGHMLLRSQYQTHEAALWAKELLLQSLLIWTLQGQGEGWCPPWGRDLAISMAPGAPLNQISKK